MWKLPWFEKKDTAKGGRAPRIQAEVPLHFREVGGFGWNIGKTENISQSGVLFKADQAVKVGTPVEMQYAPPAEATWTKSSHVSCRGRIVRTQPAPSAPNKPACAAKIVSYDADRNKSDW